MAATLYAPRCAIGARPPVAWRVMLDLPDGGEPITLRLLGETAADTALSALEFSGSGAKVRRITRQGEW